MSKDFFSAFLLFLLLIISVFCQGLSFDSVSLPAQAITPITSSVSVSGIVYFDNNTNAQRDTGEKGIPNVQVRIFDNNGHNYTTLSSQNGTYLAQNLTLSNYLNIQPTSLKEYNKTQVQKQHRIFQNAVLNYTSMDFGFSQSESSPVSTQESSPVSTQESSPVSTQESSPVSTKTTASFSPQVNQKSKTINGLAYEDKNGNGIHEINEKGFPNVTITVYDLNGKDTVKTDLNGHYSYNLRVDPNVSTQYRIEAKTPGGYIETQAIDKGRFGSGSTYELDLQKNNTNFSRLDFGYAPFSKFGSTVSGFAFLDNNTDGIKESGEKGLKGIKIIMRGPLEEQAVTTSENGSYIFPEVYPGNNSRGNGSIGQFEVIIPDGLKGVQPNADISNSGRIQCCGHSAGFYYLFNNISKSLRISDIDFGFSKAQPEEMETSASPPPVLANTTENVTELANATTQPVLANTTENVTELTNVTIPEEQAKLPPESNPGENILVDEGSTATLDGTNSTDSDGNIVGYLWSQLSGPSVKIDNPDSAAIDFVAPHVDTDTKLRFALTVTDDDNQTDTKPVEVLVKHAIKPNKNPISVDGSSSTIKNKATPITLNASDADGDKLTFSLRTLPLNGKLTEFDSKTGKVVYEPNEGFTGNDFFTFKASDGTASSNDSKITIDVKAVNQRPILKIQVNLSDPNPETGSPSLITLDGSQSYDPDSGAKIHDFFWGVTKGNVVNLTSVYGPIAKFKVPTVNSNTSVLFDVSARNDNGTQANKKFEVIIRPSKTIPMQSPTNTKAPQNTSELSSSSAPPTNDEASQKASVIDYSYLSQWGKMGKAQGQMIEPADISLDSQQQTIYIADKGNNRIDKFDTNGNFIGAWGSAGTADGQFNGPGDVDVETEGNYVFAIDIGNNRIEKFDKNGGFVSAWGSMGTGESQFDQPGDIAIDPESNTIFVTDIGNHRIQKFDFDGNLIKIWGSLGAGEGELNRPAGIWFDSATKTIYVADTNNNRVQKFDTNGTFISQWGTPGTGNGQFDNPASVGVSPYTGNVFVVDSGNKRVQQFDPDGNFVLTLNIPSVQFKRPVGIAFDASGRIYVVDKDSNKIFIFSPSETGQHIQQSENKISNNVGPSNKESLGNASPKNTPHPLTGPLKLTVSLKDTGYAEVGTYFVYITVHGKHLLSKYKEVDISNQICPGDFTSKCYTPAGTFTFPAAEVPINSKIEVCEKSPFKDVHNCEISSVSKSSMTIGVSVADKAKTPEITGKPKSQTYSVSINLENMLGWIGGIKFSIENSDKGESLASKTFDSNSINSLEENPNVSFSFPSKSSTDGDTLTVCADQNVGDGHKCSDISFKADQKVQKVSIDLGDFTLKENSSDK